MTRTVITQDSRLGSFQYKKLKNIPNLNKKIFKFGKVDAQFYVLSVKTLRKYQRIYLVIVIM